MLILLLPYFKNNTVVLAFFIFKKIEYEILHVTF